MTALPSLENQIPLLGVSGRWGAEEVRVSSYFDELHQLIYRQGGIRPTNAAVEEIAKLIYLRLWWVKNPKAEIRDGVSLSRLFLCDGTDETLINDFKLAFALALRSSGLTASTPSGREDPVWPLDEPFRLSNGEVLRTATKLVRWIIGEHEPTVSDPLGTAFDALLSGRYDHSGGLGTYLTPSSVARMMAEIGLDLLGALKLPQGGVPVFGDPYCGTGRFLVAAVEVLRESGVDPNEPLLTSGSFGADQSPSAVAKARINMMLYGVDRPLIWTVRDSVTDEDVARLHGALRLVLTNPPFGEGKYDSSDGVRQTAAAIPTIKTRERIDPALACLVKSIRLLGPGGVLGIILPDGLIESRAFKSLIMGKLGDLAGDVGVAANISLPTSTFALSGTVAKTSAVFLQRSSRPAHIALARVDHVGYIKQAGKAAADPAGSDLPVLPALVRQALDNAAQAALNVQSPSPLVASVQSSAFGSIDLSRIDPAALEARAALEHKDGIELRELIKARPASRARRVLDIPFVSVLHVDDQGNINWHEAVDYRPTTPGLLAAGGDILVSLLNPSKLRASAVPLKYSRVQVSPEFGVFEASCDPYAILGLLHLQKVRAQLRPLGRGTSSSRRRISEDDVLALVVPKLSSTELDSLGSKVRRSLEEVARGQAQLHRLFGELDQRS